jgi:hypothetical protein
VYRRRNKWYGDFHYTPALTDVSPGIKLSHIPE